MDENTLDPHEALALLKALEAPVAPVETMIEDSAPVPDRYQGNLLIRVPYVWDYDIDEETFREILAGRVAMGRLDRDWAAVRLIEFAPYREIVRILGFRDLLDGWPRWRVRIRSPGRRRGIDFLAWYLPERRPDLLAVR
jgi:hypothetical protein